MSSKRSSEEILEMKFRLDRRSPTLPSPFDGVRTVCVQLVYHLKEPRAVPLYVVDPSFRVPFYTIAEFLSPPPFLLSHMRIYRCRQCDFPIVKALLVFGEGRRAKRNSSHGGGGGGGGRE